MDLIELQAAILFHYDVNGRMLCLNEDDPEEPAPRLFLGRTKARTIWRFRSDLRDSLTRDLERLLRTEPVGTDLSQPPQILRWLIAPISGWTEACALPGPHVDRRFMNSLPN